MKAIEVLNEVYGKNPKNTDVYYPITVILEAMETYANQSKWISVEDKLPQLGERIMIKTSAQYIGVGVLFDNESFWLGELDQKADNITHWQLLPTEPCQTT